MKIAIIGAGAAGCFAAANIPQRQGLEVSVFEKTGKVMQKVKASGGGRCNVTHACFEVEDMAERYPRGRQLMRKTLHQFGPQQTIDWFQSRGIILKTETDGRMFPESDSSQTIIDGIWQEMMRREVKVYYHKTVEKIAKDGGSFIISFTDQTTYATDKILIAAGGFQRPEQYAWITALGHKIQTPVPSLFTFNMPANPITQLMGVSVNNATVKIAGSKIVQSGPLLITHWGMSGPAILKTSAVAARELAERHYDFKAIINWLGDMTDDDVRELITAMRQEQGKQYVHHKNPFDLPKRLWEHLLQVCGARDELRWGDMPAAVQNKLVEHLLRDIYEVKGKTTFKEEFVTCGGVALSEINPQTLESRIVPGLFFAGEITDVDGITGGYNFQHAWSSGWIVANNIAER